MVAGQVWDIEAVCFVRKAHGRSQLTSHVCHLWYRIALVLRTGGGQSQRLVRRGQRPLRPAALRFVAWPPKALGAQDCDARGTIPGRSAPRRLCAMVAQAALVVVLLFVVLVANARGLVALGPELWNSRQRRVRLRPRCSRTSGTVNKVGAVRRWWRAPTRASGGRTGRERNDSSLSCRLRTAVQARSGTRVNTARRQDGKIDNKDGRKKGETRSRDSCDGVQTDVW